MNRIAAIAAATLVSTAAHAEIPVFPEAWEGAWENNYVVRDCGSGDRLAEFVGFEYACANRPPDLVGEEWFNPVCEGEITDTSIDVTCTSVVEVFPGCSVEYTFSVQATRDGETVTGVERASAVSMGSCGPGEVNFCEETTYSGVRRADVDPSCELVPVEATSWSSIKSVYR